MLEEYDKLVMTGPGPELSENKQMSFNTSPSRGVSISAGTVELELSNAKEEMQRLRDENKSLRSRIEKMGTVKEDEDNATDGVPILATSSLRSDIAAVRYSPQRNGSAYSDIEDPGYGNLEFRVLQPTKFPPVKPSEPQVLQPVKASHVQALKASLNVQTAGFEDLTRIPPRSPLVNIIDAQKASFRGISSIPWEKQPTLHENAPVTEKLFSFSHSIYDIPTDFDPDNTDIDLSDIETIGSDEALQAWGINDELLVTEGTERPLTGINWPTGRNDGRSIIDEGVWEVADINCSALPTSIPQQSDFSGPSNPENSPTNCKEEEEKKDGDSSIIGGASHTDGSDLSTDDDRDSTVAGTGSDDERWLSLLRELSQREGDEGQSTSHLEEARSEGEQHEIALKEAQYHYAITQKLEHMPHSPPPLPFTEKVHNYETPNLTGTKTPELERSKAPKGISKSLMPEQVGNYQLLSLATSPHTMDEPEYWIANKLDELYDPLTPGLPKESGQPKTVGWITTPIAKDANQLQHCPGWGNANGSVNPGSSRSETDRILQSFDPEVLLRLMEREKKKVSKKISTEVPSKQPKKITSREEEEKYVEPAKPVGVIENEFRLLKESRSQTRATEETQQAAQNEPKAPKIGEYEIIKIPPPRTQNLTASLRTVDELHIQYKPIPEHNRSEMTGQKPPSPSLVKTGDLLNDPDLLMQDPTVTVKPQGDSGRSESEIQVKKTIRFRIASPEPQRIPGGQRPGPPITTATGPIPPKPLLSILKSEALPITPNAQPKAKAYNHEYIREVVIRNLPKDITYSTLLAQVSEGMLEKATIDMGTLEGRIVFAEPEAARRFYAKVEQNGFWVHTKLHDSRLLGNESCVQCTIGGFLWTQNSSQMTPKLIERVWNHCISRCLLINDFPRHITAELLTKDILKLFLSSPVKEADIIEHIALITKKVHSKTGLICRVRFSALMYATRVADSLLKNSPDYAGANIIYDTDPCGGLVGAEPPSVWNQRKGFENAKPEIQPAVPQTVSPQKNTAQPRQAIRKPLTAYRGQSSNYRGKNPIYGYGRQQSQYQYRVGSTVAPTRSDTPVFTGLAKAFDDAAKTMQAARTAQVAACAKATQQEATRPFQLPGKPPVPPISPQQHAPATPDRQQGIPPNDRSHYYSYNNWDLEPVAETPRPAGAHWNHREQNLFAEYEQTLVKKRSLTPLSDRKRVEKLRPEANRHDRTVYLTNLPRDINLTRLLRYVRGGTVEHICLEPPTSLYDTCKAIILFVHRTSAREYKSYLDSPGVTIASGFRITYIEYTKDRVPRWMHFIPSQSIRNQNLTRCLKIDMLPGSISLREFVDVIEEGMNHETLVFEDVEIDHSKNYPGMAVIVIRLASIGKAVWTAGILRKHYHEFIVEYDRDPCDRALSELEAVDWKE